MVFCSRAFYVYIAHNFTCSTITLHVLKIVKLAQILQSVFAQRKKKKKKKKKKGLVGGI
ncbi:hypothetical protein ACE6H2_016863 [Prunus campanulata]